MRANIFCLLSEIIYSRGTLLLLLILCESLPEVKFGPQKRACAVAFAYVVAVETIYNDYEKNEADAVKVLD